MAIAKLFEAERFFGVGLSLDELRGEAEYLDSFAWGSEFADGAGLFIGEGFEGIVLSGMGDVANGFGVYEVLGENFFSFCAFEFPEVDLWKGALLAYGSGDLGHFFSEVIKK